MKYRDLRDFVAQLEAIGELISGIYFALQPRRRSIVVENLLPVLGGDLVAARTAARRLFARA